MWILSTSDYGTGSLRGQLYNDNYDSDTLTELITSQKLCHYWTSSRHWILKPTRRVVSLCAESTHKCTHLSGLTNTKQFWCGVRWPSEKLSHAVSQSHIALICEMPPFWYVPPRSPHLEKTDLESCHLLLNGLAQTWARRAHCLSQGPAQPWGQIDGEHISQVSTCTSDEQSASQPQTVSGAVSEMLGR